MKPISKQVPVMLSPTATFENSNPTRLKTAETSKIAISYNFYRFRGGLAPPLKSPSNQKLSLLNSIPAIFYFCELVYSRQEQLPLLFPAFRNTFAQVIQGQRGRLPVFPYQLYDVRGKVCQLQRPGKI